MQTGIKTTFNGGPKHRITNSHDITTEPEAVIKIIKRNKSRRKGKYFKNRSNSHTNNQLVNKFKKQTRNVYNGIWNSIKKKKVPWKPSGVMGAIFHDS